MDEAFVRNRITELRIKKGVSEYQMSLGLGHSKSYMQSISSGRSMPSWTEFFNICDYLEITPVKFFKADIDNPALVEEVERTVVKMNEVDQKMFLSFAKRLLSNGWE